MSTDYTQTLKAIKEAEEASGNAVAERKKKLAEQLELAKEQASKDLATAKAASEEYIAKEVEKARSAAEADSKVLTASTVKDAEKVAERKLGKTEFKKIIEDTLLAEFQGA
ncbi:MAG: hypothetical protein JRN20_07510 [Nitrososphaerota archaeon]|nr:hypothetical protein [Nitrososphaerota archaeon]